MRALEGVLADGNCSGWTGAVQVSLICCLPSSHLQGDIEAPILEWGTQVLPPPLRFQPPICLLDPTQIVQTKHFFFLCKVPSALLSPEVLRPEQPSFYKAIFHN